MAKRILLVDDESSILFAYKKVLQGPNVIIDAVESKAEAVGLLNGKTYQAAILDLRLHDSTGDEGLELVSLIREKYDHHLIIMVITAYGNPGIKEKAYRLGADFYLEKPVSTKIIRDALESAGIDMTPAVNQ